MLFCVVFVIVYIALVNCRPIEYELDIAAHIKRRDLTFSKTKRQGFSSGMYGSNSNRGFDGGRGNVYSDLDNRGFDGSRGGKGGAGSYSDLDTGAFAQFYSPLDRQGLGWMVIPRTHLVVIDPSGIYRAQPTNPYAQVLSTKWLVNPFARTRHHITADEILENLQRGTLGGGRSFMDGGSYMGGGGSVMRGGFMGMGENNFMNGMGGMGMAL